MAIWNAVSAFTDWMWGNPLLILLVGGGIILAFIINFIQSRKFGFIWRNTIGTIFNKEEQARKKAQGVSPLQVLIAAVGATVGTGNIVGVSSAIAIGGPGALFWMFICGFIAMGIKYSEVTLGVEYREKLSNGQYRGGPFMYILKGLGWKPVAYIFGICSMVCMAMICCVHGSSMTSNAASIGIPPIVTLVFAVIFMLVVCFGGMKALCKISDVLVPVMSILYILAGLIVILINIGSLPAVIVSIFKGAFTPTAAVGGFAGAVFKTAMTQGFRRGVFSNDAGLGLSSTVQSQAAAIDHPAQQGSWSVIETFIDTTVICSITGLMVIFSGVWTTGESGATLAGSALASVFGPFGRYLCVIGLFLFGLSSLITDLEGVKLYSDNMFKSGIVGYCFQGLIIVMVIIGTFVDISKAFMLADFTNGVVLVINMICIFALGKKLRALTSEWFDNPTESIKKFQIQKK